MQLLSPPICQRATRIRLSRESQPDVRPQGGGRTGFNLTERQTVAVHQSATSLCVASTCGPDYCSGPVGCVNLSPRFFSLFPNRLELTGFEPVTSCLQSRRSPTELQPRVLWCIPLRVEWA